MNTLVRNARRGACMGAVLAAAMPASAETADDFSFTLAPTAEVAWMPETAFAIDPANAQIARQEDHIALFGAEASLGYRLPAETFLGGAMFGQRPVVALGASHRRGESKNGQPFTSAGGASLFIDGNTGLSWSSGTWYSELDLDVTDITLSLIGDRATESWSVAPTVGVAYRRHGRESKLYRIRNGARTNFIDGDLTTDMVGAVAGLRVMSPRHAGWRFGLAATASAMLADADMELVQDPDSALGGVPDLTLNDDELSGVFEGTVRLAAERQVGSMVFEAALFGSANYGMPHIDGSTAIGDAAGLATDDFSFGAGASLGLTFLF